MQTERESEKERERESSNGGRLGPHINTESAISRSHRYPPGGKQPHAPQRGQRDRQGSEGKGSELSELFGGAGGLQQSGTFFYFSEKKSWTSIPLEEGSERALHGSLRRSNTAAIATRTHRSEAD